MNENRKIQYIELLRKKDIEVEKLFKEIENLSKDFNEKNYIEIHRRHQKISSLSFEMNYLARKIYSVY